MHSLQLNLQIYFNIHYSTAYNYVYTHHMYLKTFVCYFYSILLILCTNIDFVGLILPAHYYE
jgi:hypothetical protein